MVHPLVVVWFIVVSSVSAYGNVMYIHREMGSSVKLRCESSNDSEELKVFSLRCGPEEYARKITEVLYLNIERSVYIRNPKNCHRISVLNELKNHSATVTITNLRQNDTDLYYCFFYKEGGKSGIPGKAKFFLHVEDDESEGYSCLGHQLWLYVLLTVAVLLLTLVLIFAEALCKKKPNVQLVHEDVRQFLLSTRSTTSVVQMSVIR